MTVITTPNQPATDAVPCNAQTVKRQQAIAGGQPAADYPPTANLQPP